MLSSESTNDNARWAVRLALEAGKQLGGKMSTWDATHGTEVKGRCQTPCPFVTLLISLVQAEEHSCSLCFSAQYVFLVAPCIDNI